MIALSLGATRVEEALRAVRALGAHRYVAGRMHMVHALAFDAIPLPDPSAREGDVLTGARAWARATLADPTVDPRSRDERLWRRSSDVELVALLDAYWSPGGTAQTAREGLVASIERCRLPSAGWAPFDERAEHSMHPLAVDAGWELLPLAQLNPTRHKGAIDAFATAASFESARATEQTILGAPVPMLELPALGLVELVSGAHADGTLAEPLVVWAQGHPVYVDYVVRGVRRASKLEV